MDINGSVILESILIGLVLVLQLSLRQINSMCYRCLFCNNVTCYISIYMSYTQPNPYLISWNEFYGVVAPSTLWTPIMISYQRIEEQPSRTIRKVHIQETWLVQWQDTSVWQCLLHLISIYMFELSIQRPFNQYRRCTDKFTHRISKWNILQIPHICCCTLKMASN